MELTSRQVKDILFGLRVARNQVLVAAWSGYWDDIKRIDVGVQAIEEYNRQRLKGRSHSKSEALSRKQLVQTEVSNADEHENKG